MVALRIALSGELTNSCSHVAQGVVLSTAMKLCVCLWSWWIPSLFPIQFLQYHAP